MVLIRFMDLGNTINIPASYEKYFFTFQKDIFENEQVLLFHYVLKIYFL